MSARGKRWGEVIGGLRAGIAALSDIDPTGLPHPILVSIVAAVDAAKGAHWNAVRMEAIEREDERKAKLKRKPRTRKAAPRG